MASMETCQVQAWRVGPAIERGRFQRLRRQMILEHCKWDPQVGDVSTLADFPIVLPRRTWGQLAGLAEALARESEAAEAELIERPELLTRLGMPRALWRTLAERAVPATPAAARVVRFDFHPTSGGWRISEANSDVPGGYTEASSFTRLIAEEDQNAEPAGDPVKALLHALVDQTDGTRPVGLMSATGFMEDQQITAYLARELERRGRQAFRGHPREVEWRDGEARLRTTGGMTRLGAAVRFYQAEWLPKLSREIGWERWIRGGKTPVVNPGTAAVIESKRFPLVWPHLETALPTWRALLPETRELRQASWARDPEWLIKTAYCNTGDTVAWAGQANRKRWRTAALDARIHPGNWVAQRRFETMAIETPIGPMRPCLGVYTVNGQAAGIYGRLAAGQVVDYQAVDVAVLVTAGATP